MKLHEQLIGRTVDGILITGFIGAGGMGEAFRGVQKDLKREVCIKFMKQEYLSDKESIYRFRREARALARLRHKNIISCFSVGVLDKVSPYIVTEFITGKSLRQVLEDGPLEMGRALRVVKELCDALNFVHNHGLIHRDVKPENIILTSLEEGETVKLLDFGLVGKTFANNLEGTLTDPSALIGTANYMPPEAFMGKGAERGQDVYAVGCVLHELLTGELPFSADTPIAVMHRHFNDPLPALPTTIKPLVLRSVLDAIVAKSTAVDPTERFESCAEISELLTLLLEKPDADHTGALLVRAQKPARPARGAVFSQRIRLAVMLLAGALVILTAFAIVKTQTISMSEQNAHQKEAYDISSLKALASNYRKLCSTWSGKVSLTFEQTNQALLETKRCIEMTRDLARKNSPASLMLITPAGSAEIRSISSSIAELGKTAGPLVSLDLMKRAQSELLASFGFFAQALSVLRDDQPVLQFNDAHRYNAEDLRVLQNFVLSTQSGPTSDWLLSCLRVAAPYYFLLRPQPDLFFQFVRKLNEREGIDELVPGLVEISELSKATRRSEYERLLIELVDIEVRSKRTDKAAEVLKQYLKTYRQPNSIDFAEIRIGRQIAENVNFDAGTKWLGIISRRAVRKQNLVAYCDSEVAKAGVLLHHSGKDSAAQSLHKLIRSPEFKRVLLHSGTGITVESSAQVVMPLVRLLSETGDFASCSHLMAQVTKAARGRAEGMPENSDSAVQLRSAEDLFVDSLWNNGEREAARREIKAIIARRHPGGNTMVSDRELWPLRVSSRTLLKDSKKIVAPVQNKNTSLARRLKWSIWFRDRKQVNDTIALSNDALKTAQQDFSGKTSPGSEWAVSSRVADSALQMAVDEQSPIDAVLLESLMHNVSFRAQQMVAADRAWQLEDCELFEALLDILRFAPSRGGVRGKNTPGSDTTNNYAIGVMEDLLARCNRDQYAARFLLLRRVIPAHADSEDLSIVRLVPGEVAAARKCVESVSQQPSSAHCSSLLLQRFVLLPIGLRYGEDSKEALLQVANDLLAQDRRIESAQAWVSASDVASSAGELFEAKSFLERASAIYFEGHDFDSFTKLKMAWIYARAGQPEKVRPIIDYLMLDARLRRPSWLTELKRTAESIYSLAYSLDNNQESVRHIETLLACTQKAPSQRLGAYVMLANQLLQSGNYEKALAITTGELKTTLLEVIKKPYGESYDYYHELLGSVYQRLDRSRDAVVELKASLNGRNTFWPRIRRLRKLADAQIDGGNLREARANICLAKETLEALYGASDASTNHVSIPNTAIVLAVYSRLLRAEHKDTEADLFAGKAINLLKSESAKAAREEASYVVRKLAKDFASGTPMRQELDAIKVQLGKPYTIKPDKT